MKPAVLAWLNGKLRFGTTGQLTSASTIADICNNCRLEIRFAPSAFHPTPDLVNQLASLSDTQLLRVIDYLLSRSGTDSRLQQILDESHSRWTVGQRAAGRAGLVERVPAGVQVATESIIASSGRAGDLLREAWAYVHQFQPSPSDAFSRAVRAVEAIAVEKVVPHQRDATLGNVIGQLANDGDWRLPLREDERHPTDELVIGMLRTLFRGHRDRHGSWDYSHVTLEEARTAVGLAVILVDWFAGGLIARRADS
jgi:hypothetical protein